MPKCVKCGYSDLTNADFDNSQTYCEGCMEKAIAAARAEERRSLQYHEYQIGKYNILERAVGDSCGDCGSHSIEFIAWTEGLGKYHESLICASCDGSVDSYLFAEPDPVWAKE